jgi:hypothetical protein
MIKIVEKKGSPHAQVAKLAKTSRTDAAWPRANFTI